MKGEQSTYTDSPGKEDHVEPLLNANAASSSADDEERWSKRERWSAPGRRSADRSTGPLDAIREYWWLVTSGMLAVIVGLQLMIWHDLKTHACGDRLQLGGDYNRKEPTCSSPTRLSRHVSRRPWTLSLTHLYSRD